MRGRRRGSDRGQPGRDESSLYLTKSTFGSRVLAEVLS